MSISYTDQEMDSTIRSQYKDFVATVMSTPTPGQLALLLKRAEEKYEEACEEMTVTPLEARGLWAKCETVKLIDKVWSTRSGLGAEAELLRLLDNAVESAQNRDFEENDIRPSEKRTGIDWAEAIVKEASRGPASQE